MLDQTKLGLEGPRLEYMGNGDGGHVKVISLTYLEYMSTINALIRPLETWDLLEL